MDGAAGSHPRCDTQDAGGVRDIYVFIHSFLYSFKNIWYVCVYIYMLYIVCMYIYIYIYIYVYVYRSMDMDRDRDIEIYVCTDR